MQEYKLTSRHYLYLSLPVMIALLLFSFILATPAGTAEFINMTFFLILSIVTIIIIILSINKYKIILTSDSIIKKTIFKRQEIPFSEVKGFYDRVSIRNNYSGAFLILPKSEQYNKIKIYTNITNYSDLFQILRNSFPDLGKLDVIRTERTLLNNESLGESLSERKATLKKINSICLLLNILSFVNTVLCSNFLSLFIPCTIVAELIVLFAIYQMQKRKGIYTFLLKWDNAFPNLIYSIILSTVCLFISSKEINLLYGTKILPIVAGLSIGLCLYLWKITNSFSSIKSFFKSLYILIVFPLFIYFSILHINRLSDAGPEKIEVMKRKSDNIVRSLYEGRLSGLPVPQSEAAKQNLWVIYIKNGWLGIPWYYSK